MVAGEQVIVMLGEAATSTEGYSSGGDPIKADGVVRMSLMDLSSIRLENFLLTTRDGGEKPFDGYY